MRNNNGAIVRKLIRRTLGANRKRNFFIATAIALTTFMVVSVISMGMSYYSTVAMMPFRSEGMHSHVGFVNPTPQQLEILEELDYVRHFGTHHMVGAAQLPGFSDNIAMLYADRSHWDNIQTPTYTRIVGHYATAENEIMLSRAKLAEMGITDPYIGMIIPMSFVIYGAEDWQTQGFILSAIYTEFVSASANAFTPIFVSQAFATRHGRTDHDSMSVNILFRNQSRADEFIERLLQDANIGLDQHYATHPALFHPDINVVTMYVTMGAFIMFFMFTGFLLIYNVMFISVSKDVRFFGLLKTIGTTPRQLRNLIYGQVILLYIIATPVGLGVAALASLVVVPAFIGDIHTGAIVSFSPIIYVGGTLFSLLTVFFGVRISAKKVARTSPVETVKFAGDLSSGIKRRINANGKPFRMAWRNVFRERKRAVSVLTSLFMSVTVFMIAMTFVNSFDIDNSVEVYYSHDFEISTGVLGLLDEAFAMQVANIPNVTEVHTQTADLGRLIEPAMGVTIRGFDTGWLLAFDPSLAETLDIAAFERGEIVMMVVNAFRHGERPNLPSYLLLEVEEIEKPLTVAFGGFIDEKLMMYRGGVSWNFGGGYYIIMSNNFLHQYLDDYHNTHLGVNVESGTDEAVFAQMREFLSVQKHVVSRIQHRATLEDAVFMVTVLGTGLASILGLIGIFNFINVISVGLLVRKQELATLESIGMSKKQLRSMVGCEGIIYWAVTIVASLALGTALSYGLASLLLALDPNQFPRFVYPVVPTLFIYTVLAVICVIVPLIAYRSMDNKFSLIERLREAE